MVLGLSLALIISAAGGLEYGWFQLLLCVDDAMSSESTSVTEEWVHSSLSEELARSGA